MDNNRQQHGQKVVGELPQWNSKFGFSAQKKQQHSKGSLQVTPGGLGQPRRIPVAAAAGGAAVTAKVDQENAHKGPAKAAANKATPQEPEKTPTICLFERFERLTLATPSTAAPNTAAGGLGQGMLSGAPKSVIGSAGSTLTVSSADSEQCVARVKPARRSVAFGTPSVLAYTPAQDGQGAAEAEGDDGRTPLWSNAGHTPYSLAGSSGMPGGRIQELAEDDGQEEDSTDSTAMPLITATGVQRMRASRHSGVRMELFTSVIHEVPEEVGEVTPAGAVALHCPKTPLDLTPAAGGSAEAYSSGAGAEEGFGADSDYDEGSECDLELQTPATVSFSARLHLQRATASSAAKSTTSKPASRTPAAAGKCAGKSAGETATAAGSAAAGADDSAADAESPSGGSTFTGFAGGASAEQQVGSFTPTFFDNNRRGCSKAGGSSVQSLLAGSSTATSMITPRPVSAARAATSKGAHKAQGAAAAPVWLPAGSGSRASSHARANAGASAAKTPGRAATTPATANRQRPHHFLAAAAERTPAAAAGRSTADASAARPFNSRVAVTPATAPRQRTLHFLEAAAAQRTPAAAGCAAVAAPATAAAAGPEEAADDDAFCSPPTSSSMPPPPAVTPKSKLRQPERVAVETRTAIPTELHKLLDDADAAAAAAAVLARGAQQESILGSCEVLSPVRARKHTQQMLGASEQVCTPVRRSARKLKVGSSQATTPAAAVQPMLEATNYCYQPNDALQK